MGSGFTFFAFPAVELTGQGLRSLGKILSITVRLSIDLGSVFADAGRRIGSKYHSARFLVGFLFETKNTAYLFAGKGQRKTACANRPPNRAVNLASGPLIFIPSVVGATTGATSIPAALVVSLPHPD
jgi:hypothetical protein